MNNVFLIGRLTHDPEKPDYTKGGTAVTKFSVAVDRQTKEKEVDFIRCTVFGTQAENFCKYMSKGRQVAVIGRIQTGSYKGKEGNTVYTTDIIADRVEYLGSAPTKDNTVDVTDMVYEAFTHTDDIIPF